MEITKETKALFDFLEPKSLDIKNILDIGCGSGKMSLYLAQQGYNVTALDKAGPLIQLLSEQNSLTDGLPFDIEVTEGIKIKVIKSFFEDYETEEEFDAICCFGFLHYFKTIDDVWFMLSKMQNILRKNGILLLSWLSYDTLDREEHFFPQKDVVFQYMKAHNWFHKHSWDNKITHVHGNFPKHSHSVVYSVWENKNF